ncbi:MAG: VOC family protein [Treponema sp.]|nr:VOC family protein [Treponema sp.]
MQINGFHHIGLIVKDSQKSLDFYKKLGGKVILSFPMGNTGKTINLMDVGNNAVLEIMPRGEGAEETNAHWVHIALRTDDARAAYDLAIKAGATKRTEPKDVDLGGNLPSVIAFVCGPDKEVIEFFQVK